MFPPTEQGKDPSILPGRGTELLYGCWDRKQRLTLRRPLNRLDLGSVVERTNKRKWGGSSRRGGQVVFMEPPILSTRG